MISSMTGFGAADGTLGDARASVEIRTVNHRFFSPNLKLPSALSRWENEIREVLRPEDCAWPRDPNRAGRSHRRYWSRDQ